jgi:hypothetical protein
MTSFISLTSPNVVVRIRQGDLPDVPMHTLQLDVFPFVTKDFIFRYMFSCQTNCNDDFAGDGDGFLTLMTNKSRWELKKANICTHCETRIDQELRVYDCLI